MKKDKWFITNAILLGLIILIDVFSTAGGINLGFKEGNPLISWFIINRGLYSTLFVVGLWSLLLVYLLIYVRHKLKKENHIRAMYVGLSTLIGWRAFVIGAWIGMIKVQLGL